MRILSSSLLMLLCLKIPWLLETEGILWLWNLERFIKSLALYNSFFSFLREEWLCLWCNANVFRNQSQLLKKKLLTIIVAFFWTWNLVYKELNILIAPESLQFILRRDTSLCIYSKEDLHLLLNDWNDAEILCILSCKLSC